MIKRNWKKMLLTALVIVVIIVGLAQYRKVNALQNRLDCVADRLEQAKALVQIPQPSNLNGDTVQKLMDLVDWAYDCATKEPSHSRIAPGGGSFGRK